jgi:hypothetical protein
MNCRQVGSKRLRDGSSAGGVDCAGSGAGAGVGAGFCVAACVAAVRADSVNDCAATTADVTVERAKTSGSKTRRRMRPSVYRMKN